ncbi:hypothetical protein DFH08DRAFT_804799 [Mycena albidolilacea]|uniref:Uncharacterized protein n=1 Tax=Mycena albidolilacea TaxID=1033008 RepID=A0AAD7EWL0_9AGAR|nr:hypothetical protein DFH08DRAFT_804799 [Mycena albidolilacea]
MSETHYTILTFRHRKSQYPDGTLHWVSTIQGRLKSHQDPNIDFKASTGRIPSRLSSKGHPAASLTQQNNQRTNQGSPIDQLGGYPQLPIWHQLESQSIYLNYQFKSTNQPVQLFSGKSPRPVSRPIGLVSSNQDMPRPTDSFVTEGLVQTSWVSYNDVGSSVVKTSLRDRNKIGICLKLTSQYPDGTLHWVSTIQGRLKSHQDPNIDFKASTGRIPSRLSSKGHPAASLTQQNNQRTEIKSSSSSSFELNYREYDREDSGSEDEEEDVIPKVEIDPSTLT